MSKLLLFQISKVFISFPFPSYFDPFSNEFWLNFTAKSWETKPRMNSWLKQRKNHCTAHMKCLWNCYKTHQNQKLKTKCTKQRWKLWESESNVSWFLHLVYCHSFIFSTFHSASLVGSIVLKFCKVCSVLNNFALSALLDWTGLDWLTDWNKHNSWQYTALEVNGASYEISRYQPRNLRRWAHEVNPCFPANCTLILVHISPIFFGT